TCSFSTEFTSMKMSKRVDFAPGRPFWMLRSTPFMMTRSPGVMRPVRSSSRYSVSRCGSSPPRKPSGDSWISSFCVSRYVDAPVPGQGFDPQVDLGRLVARRCEPPDRLLPRHEDVQRVAQEVDRHVRVEPVQLVERDGEAPVLRISIRDRDDLGEVAEFLEELLPLRDELVLRELYEHLFPTTRRRRNIGKAHIPLSPPSDARRVTREFRSERFHWNERSASAIIRRGKIRTRDIGRNRRHVAGPRGSPDNR